MESLIVDVCHCLQEPDQPSILNFFSSQTTGQQKILKNRSTNDSTLDLSEILDDEVTDSSDFKSDVISPARKRKRFSDSFSRNRLNLCDNLATYSEPRRKISSNKVKTSESFIVIDSDEDDFVSTSPRNPPLSSGKNKKKVQKNEFSAKNNIKLLFHKAASNTKTDSKQIYSDKDVDISGSSVTPLKKQLGTNSVGKCEKFAGDTTLTERTTECEVQWSCDMCTFLNHKSLNYCEVCESPKRKRKNVSYLLEKTDVLTDLKGTETANVKDVEHSVISDTICEDVLSDTVSGNGPAAAKVSKGCMTSEVSDSFYQKKDEKNSNQDSILEEISDCGDNESKDNSTSTKKGMPVQSRYFGKDNEIGKESPVHRRKEVVVESKHIQNTCNALQKAENAVKDNKITASVRKDDSSAVQHQDHSVTVSPSNSVKKYRFKSLQKANSSNPATSPALSNSFLARPAANLKQGTVLTVPSKVENLPVQGGAESPSVKKMSASSLENVDSCFKETPTKLDRDTHSVFSSPGLDVVLEQEVEIPGVFVGYLFILFLLCAVMLCTHMTCLCASS